LTSFAESKAELPIGTIWSSSQCAISVGTSRRFRSSLKSVSENALMQSKPFLWPHIMPCRHQALNTHHALPPPGIEHSADTLAPGAPMFSRTRCVHPHRRAARVGPTDNPATASSHDRCERASPVGTMSSASLRQAFAPYLHRRDKRPPAPLRPCDAGSVPNSRCPFSASSSRSRGVRLLARAAET